VETLLKSRLTLGVDDEAREVGFNDGFQLLTINKLTLITPQALTLPLSTASLLAHLLEFVFTVVLNQCYAVCLSRIKESP